MCTAATYKTKDFYMGRTLDYEFSYGEQITITPRNYEFDFRFSGKIKSHYALIGMDDAALVPAAAHLRRDGDLDGAHDRLSDARVLCYKGNVLILNSDILCFSMHFQSDLL